MRAANIRLFDIPFLYGNRFKKVIMSCTRYIIINFVKNSKIWRGIHILIAP